MDYQPMNITHNLFGALQSLQSNFQATWYWIDAICIDQGDAVERGQQVGLMKDIYNHASGVVVWLGQSTEKLALAVDVITKISKRFQHDTLTSPESIINASGLTLTTKNTDQLELYTEYKYEEVAHFFSLPWFRRVWVLQEAFSHTTIDVRLGDHTLSWGAVILAALWQAQFTRDHTAASFKDSKADGVEPMRYLPELWLGLLHTRMLRGLSILELTSRGRDFEATDPRDKVFALLGLANDIGPLESRPTGFIPDYTKGTTEVYADFARAVILKTRNLDVLSMVSIFGSPNAADTAVSWIPNLDVPEATIRGLGFPTKYNASFSTKVDVKLTCQSPHTAHSLHLAGFRIDTAHHVTEDAMTFSADLKLHLGNGMDAVAELWRAHVLPRSDEDAEPQRLRQYIELLTATGYALPNEFPAQPLGNIVPSRRVPSITNDFAAYWARRDPDFRDFRPDTRASLRQKAKQGDADQFGVLAGKACHERKFFVTGSGRVGLCPRGTRGGDEVVILYGGSVPFVLRLVAGGEWRFVGECYVDGVMFGEVEEGGRQEEMFCIV